MSDKRVVLHYEGFNAIRKCSNMTAMLEEMGQDVLSAAGGGALMSSDSKQTRRVITVSKPGHGNGLLTALNAGRR